MRVTRFFVCLLALSWLCWTAPPARADSPAPVVLFWEEGFPTADTAAVSRAALASLLPDAFYATSQQLSEALARSETRLLVLPFGSAFPEEHWETIYKFLQQGGSLLVLGGQPFTRAAYHEQSGWKLRPLRLAFAKQLFINEYEPTPGSQGLQFQTHEDFSFLDLPAFDWARAYSLKVRLSDEDLYPRGGSAGTLDTRLEPLGASARHWLKSIICKTISPAGAGSCSLASYPPAFSQARPHEG